MEKTNQEFQLINVEGINIYSSVYDTEQLSVIRGSSFLLKTAIEHIAEKFNGEIEAISTGASSGLFTVKNPLLVESDKLVNEISNELNTKEPYCFFTFVVTKSSHDNFQVAKETLIAKQRFLQLSTLTLAPDPIVANNSQVCAVQGNRVGTQENILPGNQSQVKTYSKISRSVKLRFENGRDNRFKFYKKELETEDQNIGLDLTGLKFTTDIQTLADSNNHPKLKDKIAVLYLDGNGFSSIQHRKIHSIRQQQKFDKHIQKLRKNFLGHLLKELNKTTESSLCFPNAKTEKDELRLETLLWGGDEMLFIVPAWMGFDLLYTFYNLSADWKYEDEPLTHAGGLVFCSSKTPISKVRSLAQQLADEIKDKDYGRHGNYFDYLVLESIDYPVERSMQDFFHKQYGELASKRHGLTPVEDWHSESGLKARLKKIITNLPKRQVYRLANQSAKSSSETNLNDLQKRFETLIGTSAYKELAKLLEELFQPPAGQKSDLASWQWMHLVELWDYLTPIKKD